jgi:RNA polymerase sigma factor (sigma-70 family)
MERGSPFEGGVIEKSERGLEKSGEYIQKLLEFLYLEDTKHIISAIIVKPEYVVDELISDIALSIVKTKARNFDEGFFSSGSYFRSIVKNKFTDYLRRKATRKYGTLGGDSLKWVIEPDKGSEDQVIDRDYIYKKKEEVIERFRKLSSSKNIEKDVEILKMMLEGYTNTEISKEIGCTDSNISVKIRRWKTEIPELIDYFNIRMRGKGSIERRSEKDTQKETLEWIIRDLEVEIASLSNESGSVDFKKAVLLLSKFYVDVNNKNWQSLREKMLDLGFNIDNGRVLRKIKNGIDGIAGYKLNYDVL